MSFKTIKKLIQLNKKIKIKKFWIKSYFTTTQFHNYYWHKNFENIYENYSFSFQCYLMLLNEKRFFITPSSRIQTKQNRFSYLSPFYDIRFLIFHNIHKYNICIYKKQCYYFINITIHKIYMYSTHDICKSFDVLTFIMYEYKSCIQLTY